MAVVSPKAKSTEKNKVGREHETGRILFLYLGLPSQARWRGSPAGQLDNTSGNIHENLTKIPKPNISNKLENNGKYG